MASSVVTLYSLAALTVPAGLGLYTVACNLAAVGGTCGHNPNPAAKHGTSVWFEFPDYGGEVSASQPVGHAARLSEAGSLDPLTEVEDQDLTYSLDSAIKDSLQDQSENRPRAHTSPAYQSTQVADVQDDPQSSATSPQRRPVLSSTTQTDDMTRSVHEVSLHLAALTQSRPLCGSRKFEMWVLTGTSEADTWYSSCQAAFRDSFTGWRSRGLCAPTRSEPQSA